MKKVFALILTIAMLATMSVTAFAAEIDQDTPAPKDGSTSVYFGVDPTYTVTIPATVELNKVDTEGVITYENDYTITADAGVRLHKNENIIITVASDYEMTTDEGATLDYTITKDGAALENDVVATFTTSTTEQASTIHIAANNPEFAGEYEDTVTFTISLETPAPATISFTIDGTCYTAEEGMTWGEWVASNYSAGNFEDDGYLVWDSANRAVCHPGATDAWADGAVVYVTDEIENGFAYTLLVMLG